MGCSGGKYVLTRRDPYNAGERSSGPGHTSASGAQDDGHTHPYVSSTRPPLPRRRLTRSVRTQNSERPSPKFSLWEAVYCSTEKMPPKSELKRCQLRPHELALIDKMTGKWKSTPTEAWEVVCAKRAKEGMFLPPHQTSVFRYANGDTHKRGASEKRGVKRMLTKMDLLRLDQARRRLIKRFDGEYRVTHAMVLEEALPSLSCSPCLRVVEEAFRENKVYYRKPREKISITSEDAKKRFVVSTEWAKKPATFWTRKVEAYVDNKGFPLPLTPMQRKRFRQTRVTGHLRKPSEGTEQGFTKPREKHAWIGFPSVNISAAVNANRVIMWHVHTKGWCGRRRQRCIKARWQRPCIARMGSNADTSSLRTAIARVTRALQARGLRGRRASRQ